MHNKIKVVGNIYVSGVYYLETVDDGKVLYVGSSKECNDALSRHLYFLKRGLYKNKPELQKEYDNCNLQFRVFKLSDNDEEMGRIEQECIHKHGLTNENIQTKVTRHSSNKNKLSTWKRRAANMGSSNPNCKYDESIIAEILWLKLNDYKPVQIAEIYKDIPKEYISQIGIYKWINLEPMVPAFIKEQEANKLEQAN